MPHDPFARRILWGLARLADKLRVGVAIICGLLLLLQSGELFQEAVTIFRVTWGQISGKSSLLELPTFTDLAVDCLLWYFFYLGFGLWGRQPIASETTGNPLTKPTASQPEYGTMNCTIEINRATGEIVAASVPPPAPPR